LIHTIGKTNTRVDHLACVVAGNTHRAANPRCLYLEEAQGENEKKERESRSERQLAFQPNTTRRKLCFVENINLFVTYL
jgi:hypothetical protein